MSWDQCAAGDGHRALGLKPPAGNYSCRGICLLSEGSALSAGGCFEPARGTGKLRKGASVRKKDGERGSTWHGKAGPSWAKWSQEPQIVRFYALFFTPFSFFFLFLSRWHPHGHTLPGHKQAGRAVTPTRARRHCLARAFAHPEPNPRLLPMPLRGITAS